MHEYVGLIEIMPAATLRGVGVRAVRVYPYPRVRAGSGTGTELRVRVRANIPALLANFYRAMHFSAFARSWDRMSSVCLSVCLSVRLSVCNVGDL